MQTTPRTPPLLLRWALFGLGAIVLGIAATACAPSGPDTLSTSPDSQASSPDSDLPLSEFRLVIIPDRTDKEEDNSLQNFEAYLEQSLDLPVTIQVAKDYDTAVDLLVSKSVAAAYLGPFTYIQAKAQDPSIEPIVAHIEASTGRPWYTSVIVASLASGITTLEDLPGKRFGFVNESSTSGFVIPRFVFQQLGIQPETDFAAIQFGGSHDSTLQLLASGEVDAVAVDKPAYLEGLSTGLLKAKEYRLVWESDPIPNPPLVINSLVSDRLKQDLQGAMINAPEGLTGINAVASAGYTIVQDADYEIIKKISDSLNLSSP